MNSDYQFLLQYTDFQSKCASIFKGIPIAELDTVKGMLRGSGEKYRIRYRGPRFGIPTDNRPRDLKRSTCLKVNATTFSVY
jgi:hypothetical protein